MGFSSAASVQHPSRSGRVDLLAGSLGDVGLVGLGMVSRQRGCATAVAAPVGFGSSEKRFQDLVESAHSNLNVSGTIAGRERLA